MADISTMGMNAAAPISRPAVKPTASTPDSAAKILIQQNQAEADKKIAVEDSSKKTDRSSSEDTRLDHVVAVSEDGDTLQVSDEAEEERIEAASGSVTELETSEASDRANASAANSGVHSKVEENFNTADEKSSSPKETAQTAREASEKRAQKLKEDMEAASEASAKRAEALKEAADIAARKRAKMLKDAGEAAQLKEERDTRERKVSEEEDAGETQQQAPSSFAGYTEQQLHQLVLDGTISRYDYDSEIKSRKDIREEMSNEALEKSREILGEDQAYTRISRMGKAIDTAYSDEANDTPSADSRMNALEKLENITLSQENQSPNREDAAALNVSL